MYIGSGDVSSLLSGLNTQAYHKLLQRFVSNEKPNYNAKSSPIDALRTGAILEDRYFMVLEDDYYTQYKATCKEMDVLTSTIDFAKIDNGNIIDFDELKSCNFDDFLLIQTAHSEDNLDYIKKNYKSNYNQVQEQLLCSGLNEANLVFLVVYSYDDEENMSRDIKPNEYVKFRVKRDESVISLIKERAKIFQTIKDYHTKNN